MGEGEDVCGILEACSICVSCRRHVGLLQNRLDVDRRKSHQLLLLHTSKITKRLCWPRILILNLKQKLRNLLLTYGELTWIRRRNTLMRTKLRCKITMPVYQRRQVGKRKWEL